MPLHGKIVVIKRSGGDGTEFPLTASCLFGRKTDCDIRIQLPQVSKEHCKIDLNENKEVMLSNLSLVNPTRVNGEAVKQAQRLKHGDVITIIDRSFRFEYPPAPTPKKKRSSLADKSETPQIVSDQQVADPATLVKREKRKSSVPTDSSCLKDGSNTSNVQALAAEDQEDEAKEEDQGKPADKEGRSPFCELYQMVKHNLAVKSPWKPTEMAENSTTPSRRGSEKMLEVKTVAEKSVEPTSQVDQSTPLPEKMTHKKRRSSSGRVEPRDGKPVDSGLSCVATPNSSKRRSEVNTVPSREVSAVSMFPAEEQAEDSSKPVATPSKLAEQSRRSLVTPAKESVPEEGTPASQKKSRQGTPQKFSASEVLRRVMSENGAAVETIRSPGKTPKRRRSEGSAVPCQNSAGTPDTPATCLSPVGHNVLASTKAQCEPDAEMSEAVQKGKSPKAKESASPLRVSPRKSPGKKIQASDVLLELELAAPPCGETSANAGTSTSSGKKRKSEKLESTFPGPQLKKKRVSFGGQLSPELFDKRLPPDSPLRKGGTPGRRSLSFLRRSLLRRSSTGGLIEQLQFELSSPKSKTPQSSPGRKASPKSASPAKRSPKAKNPSPKAKSSSGRKSEVLSSLSQRSPKASPKGKQSPSTEDPEMQKSKKSVSPSTKSPKTPSSGTTPVRSDGRLKKKSPSTKSPSQTILTDVGQSSTPVATAHRRRSGSDASRTSPGQSTAKKPNAPPPAEVASASVVKTPAHSGRPFNEGSFNQTPTVKGRFSISHVSTPSPVAGQDEGVVEAPACVTPRIPLRRKSMKSTSKKTPRSARKSVLEVIRSRRSGASRANLKVVSSWADIVKFGVSKPQTVTTTKKCTRTAIKRTVVNKPKTPAQKFKDHFSTGHAASPPTIVVGKAQRKMAQAGCPPKIVYNVALMQRNMKINEDLTGIAEMFRTPAKELKDASDYVNPDTPQAADASSTEFSVMNTPEEMGEMVVSPLGVISSEKCRMYDKEAIAWLLNEDQNSSLNDDAVQERDSLMTLLVTDEFEQDLASKQGMRTPRQKSEPQSCLTGVKRLMKTPKQKVEQVEDLLGIKRLLRTPREPKTSHEVSLVGVKDLMKTPKLKTSPLVCTTGVKRLMRTPKQKGMPVEDMFGVEQLMQTPELKVEPVESLTGVKQLKTPKQKGEPIEHLTGVEQLKTPNQKHEQVEDMIEGNQLVQTPVQKAEPVEDVTPVKHLKTPKQKGEPIEHLTGVEQLKTPNQLYVEDMVEGKQMVQIPLQKVEPVEGFAEKRLKTIKQKVDPIEDVTGVEQLQIPEQEVVAVEDMTEIKKFDSPKQMEEPVENITRVEQLKTPKQITESVEDVVGEKELMEPPVEMLESVEDLAALKQLKSSGQTVEPGEVTVKEQLKTLEPEVVPAEDMAGVKQLKSSGQNVEPNEDFTGLKQLMKTPKQKGEPVEDMTGVSRLMQTPKQKIECVEDLSGVKHLMKTPKQKGEPVEDIIGLKRLMQTPKQKFEPVEDLTGVKQIMKTPKQKGEPVEDIIGLKRLMQTPKQKFEPVEDLTGVKQIMKTPKQKGQRVESNFGIREMMKSPRQRGLPVEDFVGLQEMMEEPSDYFPPEESVKSYERTEKVSSPEHEESAPVLVTEMSSKVQYELTQPVYQSNSTSKSVRARLRKQLEKIPGDVEINSLDDGDQNFPEVKAKRSGQSCEAAAPVKRTSKKITEMDEEPIHSTVAAPTRSSRRGTKNVEESLTVATEGRRGKENKEIPQNDSPATPVRRNGRGKKANITDGASKGNEVSGIEMLPAPEQIEDAPETATVTVPIMESRKGRRPKPVHRQTRSMRKERTEAGPKPDAVKDGIAKAGTKRKLADMGTDQVTKHNDDLNEFVSLHSLPKRARARAAIVEEAKSEDKLNKTKKGAAKMSGKILDHEVKEIEPIVETPKPARRGRRNVAQPDVKPVQAQEECPTTRKVGGAKLAATRGRAKAETKMESAQSLEARPVRRTRQK
ncbi:hypothetical protein GJAV_G00149550 [Gymnothorax javanicus]|nr:hypothetical protein GJAV_G00149550 [Gymnothorax javanicus]